MFCLPLSVPTSSFGRVDGAQLVHALGRGNRGGGRLVHHRRPGRGAAGEELRRVWTLAPRHTSTTPQTHLAAAQYRADSTTDQAGLRSPHQRAAAPPPHNTQSQAATSHAARWQPSPSLVMWFWFVSTPSRSAAPRHGRCALLVAKLPVWSLCRIVLFYSLLILR